MKIKQTLALLGVIAAGSSAVANTITPVLLGGGGVGVWTYGANLSSGELHAGDGFTIYDFGGYVAGSVTAPAGWVASVSLTGNPWGLGPLGPDNPTEWNLTFTYTGALPDMENVFGATPLGTFTAVTTSPLFATDNWVSKDHLVGAPFVIDGALGPGDRGNILVPGRGNDQQVPDGGATAALLGIGMLAFGAMRRKVA